MLFIIAKMNHITPISLVDTSKYNSYSGVAIKGFDPVNYFKANKGTEGIDEFTTEWKGSTWKFVSEENKSDFMANPEKFAPQFGGYCAFFVTTGFTATPDPEVFTIYNDQLLMFNGGDVKMTFMLNTEASYETAKKNWK